MCKEVSLLHREEKLEKRRKRFFPKGEEKPLSLPGSIIEHCCLLFCELYAIIICGNCNIYPREAIMGEAQCDTCVQTALEVFSHSNQRLHYE